jgi:FAD synthase
VKIHHAFEGRPADAPPLVLAIGFFDGFHRGHREILRTLLAERRPGFRAAAITFRNHPAQYLRPGSEPPLITTCEERVNLLASTGIDELYLVPFDERLAKVDARARSSSARTFASARAAPAMRPSRARCSPRRASRCTRSRR